MVVGSGSVINLEFGGRNLSLCKRLLPGALVTFMVDKKLPNIQREREREFMLSFLEREKRSR
jgi:hypothetical protein